MERYKFGYLNEKIPLWITNILRYFIMNTQQGYKTRNKLIYWHDCVKASQKVSRIYTRQ